MADWRPSSSEFTLPFKQPYAWGLSMTAYGKGIDNAHVDVYLCAQLREHLRETVRNLLLENLRIPASGRRAATQLVGVQDLEAFRESYLATAETTLERSRSAASSDLLAVFQVALLKLLLQTVVEENLRLQGELKSAANRKEAIDLGHSLEFHESLVALTRGGKTLNRRVMRLLLSQMRKLEKTTPMRKLRATLAGEDWPIPEEAIFNPILTIPDLNQIRDLGQDYPVVLLSEGDDTNWLFQTNQCITKVFQRYLPTWVQTRSSTALSDSRPEIRERLDQGQLRGFLATEILLRRFVPEEEYRKGRCSWLDDPDNLRLFLNADNSVTDSMFSDSGFGDSGLRSGYWDDPRWSEFQHAMTEELVRCLEFQGLIQPVTLLYRVAAIRTPSGRQLPLAPVLEFVEGRISRSKLQRRLEHLRLGIEPVALGQLLDGLLADSRLPASEQRPYLDRYLVDVLTLRRDLKLAYKAYETMDGIRLVEDQGEVRLSRSNASLIEFNCRDEAGAQARKILGHTVIKADVRGSTHITEELRARGLNPASHFSLNFFDPVNRLLPEYGAEKVFVEGDAVILVLFEYEDEGKGLSVARACGLARKILQVVSLQNIHNHKHGLPPLELGLGIAFSRGDPNFLYDEGHRIMISGAINRADRLSSCSSEAKRGGLVPESTAFRVTVVSDARTGQAPENNDLLIYNVNGVKIEEDAFFKLQRELRLRQVRLPDEEFGDTLFFVGIYADRNDRSHWLVLRYGPVRSWNGQKLGTIDPRRRHFFEVIIDEKLNTQVRRLLREQGFGSPPPEGKKTA